MASITTLSIVSSLGYLTPANAVSLIKDPLSIEVLESLEENNLEKSFDDLAQSLSTPEEQLRKCKTFLNKFLKEVEFRHGITLTIEQACQLVRDNLDHFHLSDEIKASLSILPELFSDRKNQAIFSPTENKLSIQEPGLLIAPGWIAMWEHLKTKKHPKNQHEKNRSSELGSFSLTLDSQSEIPGNIIVGAVEIFAGVLLCILPHPVTFRVGVAMITDGGRRVVDGCIQADDEERLRRTYPSS